MASDGDWNHFFVARTSKKLADAGAKVHLGAHGQREGLAVHWELWMFAQGGMSPMQALRTATIVPARAMGLDSETGTLEIGKEADIAILDRNPLLDIRNIRSVSAVMTNGDYYESEPLWRAADFEPSRN